MSKAAETVGVEGKTILVIGTQQPWLEAVLLAKLVDDDNLTLSTVIMIKYHTDYCLC